MASDSHKALLCRFEVTSDPEVLSVVRSAVEKLAAVAGLAEDECRSVTLAVDEALANIIRHAYRNRRGQPIEISCRRLCSPASQRHAGRLEFVLVDRGRAIKPSEMRGRSLDQVRAGGLGTHFIRASMDEVEYKRAGGRNRLRLVKYLSKQASR